MNRRRTERAAAPALARCWARRMLQRLGVCRAAPTASGDARVLALRDKEKELPMFVHSKGYF